MNTILYVDDEELNLELFEINFRKYFNVYLAQSGDEGLKILNSTPDIALVISDMKMPGMDGIEFIKKAQEEHSNLVYFILTGYDITPSIKEALQQGLISKYFRKPLDVKEIIDEINSHIS